MESISSHITLNNGLKMPHIGLGTAAIKDAKPVVKSAIMNFGYRLIDTAMFYKKEEEIGEALQDIFKEEGAPKREELFISTKLWHTEKNDVEGALRRSLERLKLDYVDLYLIHWPITEIIDKENKKLEKIPLHKTWADLELCVKKGLCKSIGVSNFNVQILLDLFTYAEILPVINQVEIQPLNAQPELVEFCQKFGVHIMGYSPLGSSPEYDDVKSDIDENVMENNIIIEQSKKYNKTPAQILLRWQIQRNIIPIPKASNDKRLEENISLNFEISKEDIEAISSLNKGKRRWNSKYLDMFDNIPVFN